ncbi:MAG TPA: SRPBCC family protein, partial [Dehalococcoidia bacterium]|nr:SRPBCC family protein [Dehalococcoidia bacterium]
TRAAQQLPETARRLPEAARRLPEVILPPPPKRGRPSLLGLGITVAGWLAWNAALYRGQVVAEAQVATTAPAERVWDILENLDRWPHWFPQVAEAGWLGRPGWEPGSWFRWTQGRLRMVSEVDAVTPGSAAGWHSRFWGFIDRYEWQIAETQSGTTIEARRAIGGWGLWLAAPWFQMQLNRHLRDWAEALAAEAERAPAG